MQASTEAEAFDRGVRPVLQIIFQDNAKAILKFRAAPNIRKRIEELADKSTEGQLTETEQSEYAGYIRANKFVAILQCRAGHLADRNSSEMEDP
jgi:excinuclease UvrABC nuclease subunit